MPSENRAAKWPPAAVALAQPRPNGRCDRPAQCPRPASAIFGEGPFGPWTYLQGCWNRAPQSRRGPVCLRDVEAGYHLLLEVAGIRAVVERADGRRVHQAARRDDTVVVANEPHEPVDSG